jgi:beta-galactosidase/beta-glucuronidase
MPLAAALGLWVQQEAALACFLAREETAQTKSQGKQ